MAGNVSRTDCAAPAAVTTLIRNVFQSIVRRLMECASMSAISSFKYACASGDSVPVGAAAEPVPRSAPHPAAAHMAARASARGHAGTRTRTRFVPAATASRRTDTPQRPHA